MADIKDLIERKSFDGIIDIMSIIREIANTFGFKNLTAISSHALTVTKKNRRIDSRDGTASGKK